MLHKPYAFFGLARRFPLFSIQFIIFGGKQKYNKKNVCRLYFGLELSAMLSALHLNR